MSKPWEETWTRDHNSAGRWQIQSAENKYERIAEFEDFDFVTETERAWLKVQGDRALLAAAAPEMARLLLDLVDAEGDEREFLLSSVTRAQVIAALRKAGVLP